nr:histidine kinase [Bacteroidota bacterium]
MKKSLLFHIGFWGFLWLMLGFSFFRFETTTESLRLAALVVFPMAIPVYIHDYIFDYFFIKKQYILYLVLTVPLVIFFGYIIDQMQHFIEPEGDSETYGAILFFMILFTGARYLRIGTQQRMKIVEEEEKRIKVEMELKELEAKQAYAELDLLKSQVNPHFLFNSLNSIYSLILARSDIAGDVVLKLSDLMRYLLESSRKRKVLVKHELEFLKNYIDLEKIRLARKLTMSSMFEGDFDGKIISPMLLIPFIENCFKHGIGVNYSENLIEINIKINDRFLYLETSNRIAPRRLNPHQKKTGTGIENVKRRLNLLYPKRHDLHIKQTETKYFVKLKLEL